MFAAKFIANFKRGKKTRGQKIDVIGEQVKKLLQATDQKLILMARN